MPRYPFRPEILDALPEELAERFRSLETSLLEEICSRLKLTGELNEVTIQAIQALRSHGIELDEIEKAVADTCHIGLDMLDGLLEDVAEQNQTYYKQLMDMAGVTAPVQLVSQEDIWAIHEQTRQQYRNITQSRGFLVRQGRHKVMLPAAKAYQWALDQAELQVQSGAVSYNQAISGAVKQMAESGLKTVSWESGHVDSVDVAVRRAVMTGVNQLNQKYREQSMDYLETDLVEVTAHTGARDIDGPMGWENHKAWQGKVYRWSEKPQTSSGEYPDFGETCGLGSVTGIGGANCRHSYWPFMEGVSERTYTDEQLEHIDPPPFEFEGRTYTAYQAAQKQREIERTIRKLKREKAAYRAAGLEEEAQAVGGKLRRLNKKYCQFSAAAQLPEQWERARMGFVDDASREKAQKILEKSSQSDILSDTEYKGIPITNEAIQRVPLVKPEGWTDEQAEWLQEAHKDLLCSARKQPVGVEVGRAYSTDMKLLAERVGSREQPTVNLPPSSDNHILMHNHPSGLVFSPQDIMSFVNRKATKMMTVVGNNGAVYLLRKTEEYDIDSFSAAFYTECQELGHMALELNAEIDDTDVDGLQKIQATKIYAEELKLFLREEAWKYGLEFISQ